jgi:prepilin-type N-terminal cleavage/methylation domain-containing protein/prepilin-type processing-associated H-X9-DG protein
MKTHSNKAFTLIELLVVIAIIAILAAILFPVFAQAKLAAKKTSSLSNTKQLALSFYMYQGDYDDTFPYEQQNPYGIGETSYAGPYVNGAMDPRAETNWARGVFPYVKSLPIFQDHALDGQEDTSDGWGCQGSQYCSNYAFNGIANGKSSTAVPEPADTVVVSEYMQGQKEAITEPAADGYGGAPGASPGLKPGEAWDGVDGPYQSQGYPGAFAPSGGANFGFSDGHAKFKIKTSVNYGEYAGPNSLCANLEGTSAPNTVGVSTSFSGGTPCAQIHLLDSGLNTKVHSSGDPWMYDDWNLVPYQTDF